MQEVRRRLKQKKSKYERKERAILEGKDPRFLLIVGPCSIHDVESTYEYAERLATLAEEVKDRIFLVMRTYFEKPRTLKGWKGFLYDPLLDGSCEIAQGLYLARKLLVDLAERGVPTGSELLELTTAHYLEDLLTWGCIGARTSSSPPHRQLAASFKLPMGFKNSTEGELSCAINGIISASSPHTFLGVHPNGQVNRTYAPGNPHCHLVLRGAREKPNYERTFVHEALTHLQEAGIRQKLLIDCSHDNCRKKHKLQIPVFEDVVSQFFQEGSGVAGAMLESHLYEGNQPLSTAPHYGISVTDPCLDWERTEALIRRRYEGFLS